MRRPQWLSKGDHAHKRKWRRSGMALVVLLAAMGGLGALLRPRPVEVDLGTVDRGPLVVAIQEDARSHFKQSLMLRAPATGELLASVVAIGDIVDDHALLARIRAPVAPLADPAERAVAAARVRLAQAGLAQAQARVARLGVERSSMQKERERQSRLVSAGAVAGIVLEDATSRARAADHDVEGARAAEAAAAAELEEARAAFQRTIPSSGLRGGAELEVRAPFRAVVLDVRSEQGGFVVAGEPIFELADPSTLEIRVPVLTEDAAQISQGTEAAITDWGGPPLRARVREVEPRAFTRTSALGVEEQRTHVVLDVENAPDLLPLGEDWAVQASIVRWRGDDVVRAPAGALFRRGESWAAFLMVEGRAQERVVGTGHRAGAIVEVTSGLLPGDVVILYPAERVRAGQRVVVRPAAP